MTAPSVPSAVAPVDGPAPVRPEPSPSDRILAAVAYAAQELLQTDEHAQALDDVLERLGRATGVSRAYVFAVVADGDEMVGRQIYEWAAEGVTPQIDNPQMRRLPMRASGFGTWIDELLAGRSIAGHTPSFPPAIAEVLAGQDIRSILLVPIRVDRRLWGFMGFDECARVRTWTDPEVAALTTAAGVIAGSIQQEAAREVLHASERAYAAAYERERQAAERRSALDAMKDAFLETVSHELRTPLTAVLGFAETLRRGDVAGDGHARGTLLDRLHENATRLGRILDDLADLEHLTRGAMAPTRRTVAVRDAVGGILDDLADVLQGRSLERELTAAVVEVDPAALERILANLIRNAVRHTPSATPVTVRAWCGADGLELAVEDRGPGIPDEHKRRVFEPFEQGPLVSRHSPGTGVGLSVVARYALAHGGRAWIEDRPGGGTIVRVTLAERGAATGT
ncbi:MAG: GAF domain-containing sensor histidine kinase [Actinobacteria bacterium]|nr:GAF domain-containing sensor histidine kinase [Actinomycetota bacterium]